MKRSCLGGHGGVEYALMYIHGQQHVTRLFFLLASLSETHFSCDLLYYEIL